LIPSIVIPGRAEGASPESMTTGLGLWIPGSPHAAKFADSDEFGRGFRSKAATCSDRSRPGIPMIPATSGALLSYRRSHQVRL
jgi:hypothetical protein